MRTAMLLMSLALAGSAQGLAEFHTFAGFRFGGTIRGSERDTSPVRVRSGAAVGAAVGYRAGPIASSEVMWVFAPATGQSPDGSGRIMVHRFLGNVLLDLWPPKGNFQPYILGGLGATRFDSDLTSGTKFTGTAGGGVKYFFRPRLGVRIEARYVAVELYKTGSKEHDMSQCEITAGMVYRFH
jgi:opacity protein-like surface antigen